MRASHFILYTTLLVLVMALFTDAITVNERAELTQDTPEEKDPKKKDDHPHPPPPPPHPHPHPRPDDKDDHPHPPPPPPPHPHPHPRPDDKDDHPHPPHPHPHPRPDDKDDRRRPHPHPHPRPDDKDDRRRPHPHPHPRPDDKDDHPHPPHPHPHRHAKGKLDAAAENKPILTDDFVQHINSLTKGEWTATADNGRVTRHLTRAEARALTGVNKMSNAELPARVFTAEQLAEPIPASFDSAKHWPQCKSISEIRDQSSCGSCWAIAAAEAITDRYCTVAGVDRRISTADLLSCCFVCGFGCQGGWPTAAWMWWNFIGLATEECQPYPFAPCSHHSNSDKYPECPATIYETPKCNATCADGTQEPVRYKGANTYGVTGEEAYQRELMTSGPFEIAFTVYEDFVAYKSGVYSHVAGEQLGGHAVKLVGWGELNGIPYWKVANSWNDQWGDDGYFLIRRGNDECGVESSGVAGLPDTTQ